MGDLKIRIKNIQKEASLIGSTIDVGKNKKRILELTEKSSASGFWDNREIATKMMQELSDLKKEVEEIQKLESDIEALSELVKEDKNTADLAKEIDAVEKNISKLKTASFLSGPYDKKTAVVSIHAGQGGTEAMDWTSMLYRMYLKYSEKRGWKIKELDKSAGEEAGIKSLTFTVEGDYAYGYLKGEAGTHRLVRQSPFNADKLRQTSFALVEVLPELEEVDLPDIKIKDEDLEWQFFRASTQGGQNVQKVSTAVRVKHKPTQITVTSQVERHQEQNRKIALNLLRAKLWIRKKAQYEAEKKELKGEYRPASWGNQIRSYVLHPYKMVKDLRTQVETSDTEAVLSGELDQFIEAELKMK